LGKASLKFSRLDSLGSSLSLNTFASLRKQVAEVQADWYVLPTPSRWYLNPLIEFRREDEPQFEFIETNVRLAPALSWDAYGHHVHMVVGPQFSLTQTFEGGPEGMTQFLSAIFQAVVTSHDFEYFRESPRTGYTVDFKSSLNHENVGSSVTAQQLALHYSFLWNVLNYDPPLLILGVRGDLSTTLTDTENPNIWRLPPSFRYYRGGSANLRGFSLGELPSPGPGALTAASLGVEARLGEVLPWHLEPLAFFDVGALGQTSLDLDNPLYWSPGGGLRWASPIGNIRGTVAHGFVHGSHFSPSDLSHWQFYLSFGEEF
jgi:translocation and assembly module TamA